MRRPPIDLIPFMLFVTIVVLAYWAGYAMGCE